MKNIAFVAILSLSINFFSCQNSGKQNSNSGLNQINTTLSVEDYEKQISENKETQLIDVRTPGEFAQGHLKGAVNYNISASDFENQIATLDKNKPVFVYCLSGGRSASAADFLEEKGFSQVYNMKGGIMKWSAEGKALDDGTAIVTSLGMSTSEFEKLTSASEYVLVDFNAAWCKPCIKMAPMLQGFADKHKNKLTLVKIDADENKNLLKEKGIESVPVLQLFKNGELVWKHDGEIDEASLIKETNL